MKEGIHVKSKVLKIGTVLLTCVCLISIIIIPVSAESSYEALPITVTKVWTNAVADNTYTKWADNYYYINIPYDANKYQFASIWNVTNPDVNNFYNYKFIFNFNVIEPTDFTCTFNGTVYEVKKDTSVDNTYYIEISNLKINTTSARLDFSFSWNSAWSGAIYFLAYYQYSDINTIIENDNKNTQSIIEAQQQATQEQTDQITDGWDGGEKMDDSAINDFSDAESAALGGKSDEDIQAEVDGALDGGTDTIDWTKAKRISSFFDTTLNTFGPDYKTLLVLSLTLGLAAFLTGRRYSQ